jgi:hypothetical protein
MKVRWEFCLLFFWLWAVEALAATSEVKARSATTTTPAILVSFAVKTTSVTGEYAPDLLQHPGRFLPRTGRIREAFSTASRCVPVFAGLPLPMTVAGR